MSACRENAKAAPGEAERSRPVLRHPSPREQPASDARCFTHDVIEPLTAVRISAETALRLLAGDARDHDKARQAIERVIKHSQQASEAARDYRRSAHARERAGG